MTLPKSFVLARAAATDAANKRMRRQGRAMWNKTDYNIAVRMLNRLWPAEKGTK